MARYRPTTGSNLAHWIALHYVKITEKQGKNLELLLCLFLGHTVVFRIFIFVSLNMICD